MDSDVSHFLGGGSYPPQSRGKVIRARVATSHRQLVRMERPRGCVGVSASRFHRDHGRSGRSSREGGPSADSDRWLCVRNGAPAYPDREVVLAKIFQVQTLVTVRVIGPAIWPETLHSVILLVRLVCYRNHRN